MLEPLVTLVFGVVQLFAIVTVVVLVTLGVNLLVWRITGRDYLVKLLWKIENLIWGP